MLDKMTLYNYMDPSQTYIRFVKEVGQGKNNALVNSSKNKVNSMESVGKDLFALFVNNIAIYLEMTLNSIT